MQAQPAATAPPDTGLGQSDLSPAPPETSPPPGKPRALTLPKLEDRLTIGGQLDTRLVAQHLIGHYDLLLGALNKEMRASWQNQDLAALYRAQLREQLGDTDASPVIDQLMCGRKVCLVEIGTPEGGVPPTFPIANVPMGTYQSVQFRGPDGRTITRLLFIPPNP